MKFHFSFYALISRIIRKDNSLSQIIKKYIYRQSEMAPGFLKTAQLQHQYCTTAERSIMLLIEGL